MTSIDMDGSHAYRFGRFRLDLDRGALTLDGNEIRLRPQAYEVLKILAENHGKLVAKNDLLQSIWGNKAVTDNSLTHCLIDIRKAIGDVDFTMIRTVPRRGFVFTVPVTEERVAAQRRERVRKPAALAALSLIAIAATATWFLQMGVQPDSPQRTGHLPNSIVVLPFMDMSEAGDQRFFADGIAEEILNLLSRIPELKVIARTSSFSFRDRDIDIATIAEQLNVGHALEGSVRKSGDRLRITAQLIDTATSLHLWSETYDREVHDVLQIQSEIARAVANQLQVRLLDEAERDATLPHEGEAHELLLQARFFYNRRAPGDIGRAEQYYRRVLDIDAAHAAAWAGLAGVYSVRTGVDLSVEESMRLQRGAVEQALAGDPASAEAHARAGRYFQWSGDLPRAAQHFETAYRLNPNSPLVLAMLAGEASFERHFDEAIALQQRAVSLDPLAATYLGNLGWYLFMAGRHAEAETAVQRMLDLDPSKADDANDLLACVLIMQGRFDEALPLVARRRDESYRNHGLAVIHYAIENPGESAAAVRRLVEARSVPASIRLAEVYAHRGATEEVFRWIERARLLYDNGEQSSDAFSAIRQSRVSPYLVPVHGDPRWHRWMEETRALSRSPSAANSVASL